jgi:predicted GTPase
LAYHPGETNFLRADVIIINKVDSADPRCVRTVAENIRKHNPKSVVLQANSRILADNPALIRGKRALVVEDGPTLTHGGMSFGAGVVAAKTYGASFVVDPRQAAAGSLREMFARYPQIGALLPAMGYNENQMRDLEETIRRTECDVVIVATPVDLTRLLRIEKPTVRVRYELEQISGPLLESILNERFLQPEQARSENSTA